MTEQQQKPETNIDSKIKEYLESNQFTAWVEEKITPTIEEQVKEFYGKNQDKVNEYAANPQKFEEDFFKYFKVFDYVDYILTAIDIALIASIVVQAVGGLFSGGATWGTLAATLAGRQGFKAMVRAALLEVGSYLVRRVLSKISLRTLKQVATRGTAKIGVAFAQEFAFRMKLYIFLRSLLSVAEGASEATIIVLKNVLREHATEYGIPPALLGLLLPAQGKGEFINILKSQIGDTFEYMKRLVTTNSLSLTIGAVARLLGLRPQAMWAFYRSSITDKIQKIKGRVSPTNVKSTIREKLQRQLGRALTSAEEAQVAAEEVKRTRLISDLEKSIKNADIPASLTSAYKTHLIALIENAPMGRAEETLKKALTEAHQLSATIVETLKELLVLSFIEENEKALLSSRFSDELQNLLNDVTNIQSETLADLMDETQSKNMADLMDKLARGKKYALTGLTERFALGQRDSQKLETLQEEMAKDHELHLLKANLRKLIFEDRGGTNERKTKAASTAS